MHAHFQLTLREENCDKVFYLDVEPNMFGARSLVKTWGRAFTALNRAVVFTETSPGEAEAGSSALEDVFVEICRRRIRSRYEVCALEPERLRSGLLSYQVAYNLRGAGGHKRTLLERLKQCLALLGVEEHEHQAFAEALAECDKADAVRTVAKKRTTRHSPSSSTQSLLEGGALNSEHCAERSEALFEEAIKRFIRILSEQTLTKSPQSILRILDALAVPDLDTLPENVISIAPQAGGRLGQVSLANFLQRRGGDYETIALLNKNGVDTIEAVTRCSHGELASMGLSPAAIAHVETALKEIGIRLGARFKPATPAPIPVYPRTA